MADPRRAIATPTFFDTPRDLRRWLASHHRTATELWVGFRKKATGLASVTYPEALDEALAVGWIDGVRRSLGDDSYMIRFTPRKSGSQWSDVNIRKVRALIGAGRMKKAGLAAFERRATARPRRHAHRRTAQTFAPAYERQLRTNRAAWEFFEAQPPGYRRLAIRWVMSAVKEETRQRRLRKVIEDSATRQRMDPMKPMKKT